MIPCLLLPCFCVHRLISERHIHIYIRRSSSCACGIALPKSPPTALYQAFVRFAPHQSLSLIATDLLEGGVPLFVPTSYFPRPSTIHDLGLGSYGSAVTSVSPHIIITFTR